MNEVQPREEETSGLGLHDQAQNHIHNLPARSPCRRHLQALQRPPRREPHVREAAAAASPFCCRGFQTLLLACLLLVHRSIFVYLSSARCKRREPLCCSTCGSARRPPSRPGAGGGGAVLVVRAGDERAGGRRLRLRERRQGARRRAGQEVRQDRRRQGGLLPLLSALLVSMYHRPFLCLFTSIFAPASCSHICAMCEWNGCIVDVSAYTSIVQFKLLVLVGW